MTRATRTLLRVAGVLGVVAAIAYFAASPVPERDRFAARREWSEYRTRSFRRLEADLQRADPAILVRSAVAALQARDYRRLLAHCSERIQRRFTPDGLADRFDVNAFPLIADVVAFAEPVPLEGGLIAVDVFYQHRDRVVAYRWRLIRTGDSAPDWRIASFGPAPTRDPREPDPRNPDPRNDDPRNER